jgi:hypothetical protein
MHATALLRAAVRHAGGVLVVSWLSVVLVGRVYDFHRAYLLWIEQTRSERWLLEQCRDAAFFRSLASHTDVCAQVVANSMVWPTLHAARASTAQLKMCGFCDCATAARMLYTGGVPAVCCLVLLYVLTPSFLFPAMRSVQARRAQALLQARCSPLLLSHSKALPRGAGNGFARFANL